MVPGHQYSAMQLRSVWKCKSAFVAIIYGLSRLSRSLFSASSLLHNYRSRYINSSVLHWGACRKGYSAFLPYQCSVDPAHVLISHLVPFHSKQGETFQENKFYIKMIMKKRFLSPWSFSTSDCPWEKQHPIALSNAKLTFSLTGENKITLFEIWWMCPRMRYLPYALVSCYSSFVGCPHPWNFFLASGCEREAQKRDAPPGCVFWCAAQSSGENVPKAKIYQQARQEKTRIETRA